MHIELATRSYPMNMLSFVEAICGTAVVCYLSRFLVEVKWLKYIGQHTLLVMCIHQLDFYWVIWSKYISSWPVAMILRTILDFGILFLFLYCISKFDQVIKQHGGVEG